VAVHGTEDRQQMTDATPTPDVPHGLVAQVLEAPTVSEDRLAAGRCRAAEGPLGAEEIADAVVAEGPPLLHV
jgi:hypothetical protein